MVTLDKTMEDMNFNSDKISTQARWFAGGVVILLWGLITTKPPAVPLAPWTVALVGLLAVSVLFVDFCQYAFGYVSTRRLHRAILATDKREVEGYNTRDFAYRARTFCFYAKQVLAVATFIALLYALVPALIR